MSNNSFLPIDSELSNESKRKRDKFWKMLYLARADFFNETVENHHPTTDKFFEYMLTQFGIKVDFDSFGHITQNLIIKDESKYLLFLMKYGS